MYTINPTRWKILTPRDPEYPEKAKPFGATWQHLAVDMRLPERIRVLPSTYLRLSASERTKITVK